LDRNVRTHPSSRSGALLREEKMKRVYAVLAVISGLLIVCGRSNVQVAQQPRGAAASSALTVDECNFFDVDGTVRICHFTGSAKKPYTILLVSGAGCVDGHSTHPNDYVPTGTDVNCSGGGCFPAGAPVDPTIPCCEGLVAQDGFCTVGGSDGGTSDGGTCGGLTDGGCDTGDGGTCSVSSDGGCL
jgi:hypothetical protein